MKSQFRTRRIALVGALTLTMSLTAGLALAQNNASGDKSTGGVGYTQMSGFAARGSFNAHHTPNNPDTDMGQVNFDGIGPAGLISYKGTVDCYNRLSDNSARFSGVVTESNDPMMRGFFEVVVADNGTPGRNGDLISQRLLTMPAGSDCGTADPARPVESGNLVVHH